MHQESKISRCIGLEFKIEGIMSQTRKEIKKSNNGKEILSLTNRYITLQRRKERVRQLQLNNK